MKILKIAARTFNKTEERIRSKSKKRELVYIRAAIAYILKMQGINQEEIGRVVNRKRSTVVHLIKIHFRSIKYDDYSDIYYQLRQAYEDWLEDDRILFGMYLTGCDRRMIESEYERFLMGDTEETKPRRMRRQIN